MLPRTVMNYLVFYLLNSLFNLDNSYYSAKLNNILVLIDLAVPSANGGQTANVSARSADVNILQ